MPESNSSKLRLRHVRMVIATHAVILSSLTMGVSCYKEPLGNQKKRANKPNVESLIGLADNLVRKVATTETKENPHDVAESLVSVFTTEVHKTLKEIDETLPALSPEVQRKTGDDYREYLIKEHGLYAHPQKTSLVKSEWKLLLKALNQAQGNYVLTLVDDETVNAYAFIGNNVVVTRGLVDILEGFSNPSLTIRFVLAHELGHLFLGHTERSVRRAAATERLAPGAGVGPKTIDFIIRNSPFNKPTEFEADCFARSVFNENKWSLAGGGRVF